MALNIFNFLVIQYGEQSDIALTLIVKCPSLGNAVDLNQIMKFSITPVPHNLGTPGGFLNKTNKAALFHVLTENTLYLEVQPNDTIYIQDDNVSCFNCCASNF